MLGWGCLTYIRRVLYNVNFGNKYIGKSQSSLSSKTKYHLTIITSMFFFPKFPSLHQRRGEVGNGNSGVLSSNKGTHNLL